MLRLNTKPNPSPSSVHSGRWSRLLKVYEDNPAIMGLTQAFLASISAILIASSAPSRSDTESIMGQYGAISEQQPVSTGSSTVAINTTAPSSPPPERFCTPLMESSECSSGSHLHVGSGGMECCGTVTTR